MTRKKESKRPHRKPRYADSNPTDGFTLVEILVALVLVGLIAALSAGFFSQLRVLEAANREHSVQSEIDAVVRHIESTIEGAMPIGLLGGDANRRVYLSGSAHSARFVAVARTGFAKQTLREVQIAAENQAEPGITQQLRLRRLADDPGPVAVQTIPLLEEKVDLRFRFLARGDKADDNAWRDSWDIPMSLPAAVAISVVLERDGTTFSAEGLAVLPLARSPADGGNSS